MLGHCATNWNLENCQIFGCTFIWVDSLNEDYSKEEEINFLHVNIALFLKCNMQLPPICYAQIFNILYLTNSVSAWPSLIEVCWYSDHRNRFSWTTDTSVKLLSYLVASDNFFHYFHSGKLPLLLLLLIFSISFVRSFVSVERKKTRNSTKF